MLLSSSLSSSRLGCAGPCFFVGGMPTVFSGPLALAACVFIWCWERVRQSNGMRAHRLEYRHSVAGPFPAIQVNDASDSGCAPDGPLGSFR